VRVNITTWIYCGVLNVVVNDLRSVTIGMRVKYFLFFNHCFVTRNCKLVLLCSEFGVYFFCVPDDLLVFDFDVQSNFE